MLKLTVEKEFLTALRGVRLQVSGGILPILMLTVYAYHQGLEEIYYGKIFPSEMFESTDLEVLSAWLPE